MHKWNHFCWSELFPSEITFVGNSAFEYCDFQNIKFSYKSKLKTIANNSFSRTPIENITILSNVTVIGVGAFSECYRLQHIEFLNESKLQTIQEYKIH